MSENGWIKIHRKIVNNWIWENPDYFRAWIDILLMVNHQEKKITINGKLVTIKRGEKLTSIVKLADRWHWSRNRVKRFLDLLEQDAMCTTNRSAFGTTLKVSNYAEYRDFQRVNRTAFEPSNESANGSAVGSTVGPQTIMNKESSNNANNFLCGADAQKKVPPDRSEVEAYCREKKYNMDIDGFMTYYNMNGWTLSGGRKISDWKSAVDYWHQNGKKLGTAETKPAPYFDEFENRPVAAGVEVPFKGGLAAEMIRRKQKKHG